MILPPGSPPFRFSQYDENNNNNNNNNNDNNNNNFGDDEITKQAVQIVGSCRSFIFEVLDIIISAKQQQQ